VRVRLANHLKPRWRIADGIAAVGFMDEQSERCGYFSSKFSCPDCGYSLSEFIAAAVFL